MEPDVGKGLRWQVTSQVIFDLEDAPLRISGVTQVLQRVQVGGDASDDFLQPSQGVYISYLEPPRKSIK